APDREPAAQRDGRRPREVGRRRLELPRRGEQRALKARALLSIRMARLETLVDIYQHARQGKISSLLENGAGSPTEGLGASGSSKSRVAGDDRPGTGLRAQLSRPSTAGRQQSKSVARGEGPQLGAARAGSDRRRFYLVRRCTHEVRRIVSAPRSFV